MTLKGATSPDLSGPQSDCNKGVLRIPQSSSIKKGSTSDCLVSYPTLTLCRDAVCLFCSPNKLGQDEGRWTTKKLVLQNEKYEDH